MYIAMNRFLIAPGQEATFEQLWRQRQSYLHDVPGFEALHLLRGAADERGTVFISHSRWTSEAAFRAWTDSEAFRLAHRQAKIPDGVLLGPPQFEGFTAIDLTPARQTAGESA